MVMVVMMNLVNVFTLVWISLFLLLKRETL